MRNHRLRWATRLGLAVAATPLIAGCGGGGGAGSLVSNAGGSGAVATRKTKLTRFDVDVTTGKVRISTVDDPSRAILAGGAVSFKSTDLLSVGGDSGKRHITLTANNLAQEGFTTGRIVVSNLNNALGNYVKNSVNVSTTAGSGAIGHADGVRTPATFNTAQGIGLGDGPSAGSYFVSDSANSTIRQIFPDGTVSTFAGLALSAGSVDGTGSAARFKVPVQVAVDNAGNVFVADSGNDTIRRITPLGVVSTITGVVGTAGNTDGVGNVATLNIPTGIAVVPDGSVIYVSESHDIRRISWNFSGPRNLATSYSTSTVTGSSALGSVDGDSSTARFNKPFNLALGQYGTFSQNDLYVTDFGNNAVRRVNNLTFGAVTTTVAGGNGAGSLDGPGTVAQFDGVAGIAVVPTNTFGGPFVGFVSNRNSGLIKAIAFVQGNGQDERGNYRVTSLTSGTGYVDGDGNTAKFSVPMGIAAAQAAGPSATLEIIDQTNQRVRKLTVANVGLSSGGPASTVAEPVRMLNWDQELPNGNSQTVAWAKTFQSFQQFQGAVDLQFFVPAGVSGFSFTAYIEGDTQLINLPAVGASYVTTMAGNGIPGDSNGPGRLAQFNSPFGIAANSSQNFQAPYRAVISDSLNHKIKAIDSTGAAFTLAGSVAGFTDGPVIGSKFNTPKGVAIGPDGTIYIADNGNHRVRRIVNQFGQLTVQTIAGTGTNSTLDGNGAAATFGDLLGISVDQGNNIYVSEGLTHIIRKVSYLGGDPTVPASYSVLTIAGKSGVSGSTNGVGSAALFNKPFSLYADTDGKVYIADTSNSTIRVLTRTGANIYTSSTLAGVPLSTGSTDGIGTAARFNLPAGITGDTAHNLYVADFNNNRIRRISPLGAVVTLVGSTAGLADGPNGQFHSPIGISIDGSGNLLISDQANNAVRSVQRLITDGQTP